ncbi:MAG TPA: mechanosensitive ion channel family protein [Candidatus Saccharimonadales bacterium]
MWDSIYDWLQTSGTKIAVIILIAWVVERFSAEFVSRLVKGSINPDNYASEREERLREKTITSLAITIVRVGIAGLAFMFVLSELSVDIGPLLAGAGVIGFALGFGAQSLIKDFIAGIYIVLENQYRVGDIVRLNDIGGKVQKITTRITVLRDLDGNVHYIPNGSINMATNMTMEYAKVNLNIGVSYDSDIDKVKQVINDVGLELSKDEAFSKFITEAPYFARITDFGDSALVIKIFGKVLPAKQWMIEGELRQRLKKAFDQHKIEIPFPQRVIHNKK